MPSSEKNETYVSAEGKSISPIAVIYEHQFLAHQIAARSATGHVDTGRVLLYPRPVSSPNPSSSRSPRTVTRSAS
ncbi:hypothetical protein ACFQ3Z_26960 [Streptomyces nogalater]